MLYELYCNKMLVGGGYCCNHLWKHNLPHLEGFIVYATINRNQGNLINYKHIWFIFWDE